MSDSPRLSMNFVCEVPPEIKNPILVSFGGQLIVFDKDAPPHVLSTDASGKAKLVRLEIK